jgi:hypothetical protein
MATPPAPPLWTLNASGITGGSNGADLAGCHIAQSAAGVYTLYKPNWDSLATFSGSPLTCTFNYDKIDGWSVTLATAVSGGNANGGWSTPGSPARPDDVGPQSGDYTAQTGGGVVPEEKAASSAGYGKK